MAALPNNGGSSSVGVLIVGGAHVSIGIARSLGRHGVPVWLLANHPIPRHSRYVTRCFDWPGADHADGLSSMVDMATKHGLHGWVLIATGDQDMRLIAQNHALLSQHFRVATPNWDTVQWIYDKRLTYKRAAELGIDYPASFQAHSLDEVMALDCRFPVILKPAYRAGADAFTQAKAWMVEDRDALAALYSQAAALVGDEAVIVQEWIPGSGCAQYSYAGLWQNGEPLVSLTARRTRQHPIDFGRSSTFVETIEAPDVEELSARFLKSITYTGVAEVEFKYDARDGEYKLLDVNGRFWTWNGLGERAGTDFPYLAYKQALGETVAPSRARPGIAWMHASRDVIAAAQEMRRGTLGLSGYLKGLAQPMCFASFALDDPMPAVMELPVAALNKVATAVHSGAAQGWRARLAALAPRRIAKS